MISLFVGIGLACLAILPQPAGAQETAKDVPPTHWAYQAVQDLAAKGLIKGYPPDNNFLGGRTLTRYEMATIVQRVLARMDDLLSHTASKDDLDKLNASVAEIRELVNSFKTELTVIGTDMDKVKSDLEALKGQVGDLDTRMGSLSKKVDETNVAVDQALENVKELQRTTSDALAKKVEVGVGKLRVSGLLQVWYGTAFGDTLGGNSPTNFSAVPPGRNFGGGVGDTFRIRRGEIALTGNIDPKVDYRVMFDVAKSGSGSASVLQDLWVGYQLVPRWRLEVGQQKTGLSEEGTRSSSQLLTIARSIMNEDLPRNAGRIGDVRDAGVALRFHSEPISAFLGLWNDNGVTQNGVDNNRLKFLDGAVYYTGIRHVTLGIWGGTNVGDSRPAEARDRVGGTFIAQVGPHFLESEFAYARDYAAGAPGKGLSGTLANGGYLLYAYTLSRKWQLVARYDIWDPSAQSGTATTENGTTIPQTDHKLKEYTIGFNYYLHAHNAKIQVNYIREDAELNAAAFFGKPRSVLLTNFQVSF